MIMDAFSLANENGVSRFSLARSTLTYHHRIFADNKHQSHVFHLSPIRVSNLRSVLCRQLLPLLCRVNSIILSRFLLDMRALPLRNDPSEAALASSIKFQDLSDTLGAPVDSSWVFGEEEVQSESSDEFSQDSDMASSQDQ